jgi:hypothetical protein
MQKRIKWHDANSSLRREKTMWTRLGQHAYSRAAATEAPCLYSIDIDNTPHAALLPQDPLTIFTQELSGRLCTSMRLGAAWRLMASGLCMVPALPPAGRPRCPVVMPLHDE